MDEMTNLHTFDIAAPDATLYTGSGRINGTVLNQFSVSEHGVLRVATTVGQWNRWWMDDLMMSSQLVTLVRSVDMSRPASARRGGKVNGIAPGERIWALALTATEPTS